MTDNADGRWDYGDGLRRRKAAVERAAALVASMPGDPRLPRLAMLVEEVAARRRAIPSPIIEHLGQLALKVAAERDVVRELASLGDLASPEPDPEPEPLVVASDDEEPPL